MLVGFDVARVSVEVATENDLDRTAAITNRFDILAESPIRGVAQQSSQLLA